MVDIAAIASTFNRSAQQHAQAVSAGLDRTNNDIAKQGQKSFDQSQSIVGANQGKNLDILA